MATGSISDNTQPYSPAISKGGSTQERIDALAGEAWALRIKNHERAYILSKEAYALSTTGEYTTHAYEPGLAASLICLAFLDSEVGNLNLALSKCNRALALVENWLPSYLTVDLWHTLGWVYFYLGDHPTALNYGLKALDMARELGYRSGEAWALDSLASFDDEFTQFASFHVLALEIFKELDDKEGQYRVLNNWAYGLLEQGKHEIALDTALRGLELVQQSSVEREEINLANTIGEIYIAMGKYAQAYKFLEKAKSMSDLLGYHITYISVLSSLGKVHLAQNELSLAENFFLDSLKISTILEVRNQQMLCHKHLSALYEEQGEVEKALEHYKQFHTLKESISGESAARQITLLKMSHQIETARRDLEIERLHSTKLQLEIEEQRRVQAILENLATRDSLTNLYNRRHFLNMANQEWKRALRYKSPLTALMLDIDQFKQINDQFGHAVGDQALLTVAGIIQSALRTSEIAGRYGGDEFAVILPETLAHNGLNACERIRGEISNQVISTEKGSITLTVSIGLAGLTEQNQTQIPTLDALLNRADKALYNAKNAGKNQFHIYSES